MSKSIFQVLFLALFAESYYAACLYNTTHCQCSQGHDGGLCLRYEAGSGSSTSCLADGCSSAYKCDCMGSSVCPLQSCTKWKWTTTPSTPTTISHGDQVTCYSEEGVCVGLPTNDIVTPCIHNSTHCQCDEGHEGGICLRFLSGTSSSASCMVENCHSGGFKCDCMGTKTCELKVCGRWSSPTASLGQVVGDTVPCSYVDALSANAGTCPHPLN